MYRLVADEGALNLYLNTLDLAVDANPSTFNQALYVFLRHHSRPVTDCIFEGGFFNPVKMIVTIRTDLSNEVLVPDCGKFYTDCTASYPDAHPIDDVVMLAAKSLIDNLFDCGDDLFSVIPRTIAYPVGACVYNDEVYVYVTVVIDHTLKRENFFRVKGCHFEHIANLSPANTLEEELINKLVIVKGDADNA